MPSPVLPPKKLQAQGLGAPLTPQPPVPLCHMGGHEGDKDDSCTTFNLTPCLSLAIPSLPGPDQMASIFPALIAWLSLPHYKVGKPRC